MFYWAMKWLAMGPMLRFIGRPKVEGAEHIPESGGALIASNHLAVADSFFMPLMIKRRVTFPAKAEYFTSPGAKGWLKKQFFTAAGQVPIDRTSSSAARAALETCKRLLAEGDLVGIYPEGTRSPDGKLYRGKTGVARMAVEARVPVIPVVMIGTDKVNPIGSKMWHRGKVTVRFGRPLDFSRYYGMEGDRFVERSITDEIMYELMDLGGQEYVDLYAAKVKLVMDRTGRSADEVVAEMKAASAAALREPVEVRELAS